MTTITQQLSNLGTINQQLSTLSQQLNGLNQQQQNLQNFQNFQGFATMQQPPQPTLNSVPNLNNNNDSNSTSCNNMIKSPDPFVQSDLFQSNQELLNRLQNLALGFSNNNFSNSINSNYSPQNSFLYTNPSQYLALQSNGNNNNNLNTANNNLNLMSTPSSIGNLTPSPTFNRSPYSSSPMLDNSSVVVSVDLESKHSNSRKSSGESAAAPRHTIRPISSISHGSSMTVLDSNGKLKVLLPASATASESRLNTMPSSSSSTSTACGTVRKSDKHVTIPDFTLEVTDECGNITNAKKLSATPSFITRSTSEKSPSRSQLMNEVQRTAWARHTTK